MDGTYQFDGTVLTASKNKKTTFKQLERGFKQIQDYLILLSDIYKHY